MKTPQTITEARDPNLLAELQKLLEQGKSLFEIRTHLGLGPARYDRRWREIQRVLAQSSKPDNEDEALLDYYSQANERQAKMERLLTKLEKMVDDGPQPQIAKDRSGKKYAVADKNYHHLLKYNMELL